MKNISFDNLIINLGFSLPIAMNTASVYLHLYCHSFIHFTANIGICIRKVMYHNFYVTTES